MRQATGKGSVKTSLSFNAMKRQNQITEGIHGGILGQFQNNNKTVNILTKYK